MDNSFNLPYEVAYYDTDLTGKMTLERLIAVAILVSEKQSTSLNRDASFLKPLGLGWVITEYQMEISEMPKLFDQLKIYTRATTWNKFFCYRDFWVENEAGEKIITIHSTFVLMDLETRKIKTVPENVIAPFKGEKSNKIKRGEKLPEVALTNSLPYRVRYFDLDVNQHVNNSKYFSWMLDPLEKEFLTAHEVKKVFVRFDKEVNYGEMVESFYTIVNDNQTRHEIRLGDTLCCEAQIMWQ